MDNLNNYWNYDRAKQELVKRLDTTDDEIAQWVSIGAKEGGLDAFTIKKYEEPKAFTFDPRHFIHNDNYLRELGRLYFLPEDIGRFQPAKRYISRQALITRWTSRYGGEDEAINKIQDSAKDGYLPEYHPIAGCVNSEDELFRNGIFDMDNVQEIERDNFGGFFGFPFKADDLQEDLCFFEGRKKVLTFEMPYRDVEYILKEKFNATEQEIVRWILDKEITPKDMWVKVKVGGKDRLVPNWDIGSYEYFDETEQLQSLKFNEDEINNFLPKVRWLTFYQVMERWPKSEKDTKLRQKEVAVILREKLPAPKNDEIDEGKNLNLYLYPLEVIDSILPFPKQLDERDINQQAEIMKERQKAFAEIKASRVSSNDINSIPRRKLLEKPIADLLIEAKPKDELERHYLLHRWLNLLDTEREIQNSAFQKLMGNDNINDVTEHDRYDGKMDAIRRKKDEIYQLLKDDLNDKNDIAIPKLKPIKKLISKERGTTELLCLIYELFDFYGLKIGDERGKHSAKTAWGDLVARKFQSDLITAISGTRDTVTITMNRGDEIDFDTFSRTYNRRFK